MNPQEKYKQSLHRAVAGGTIAATGMFIGLASLPIGLIVAVAGGMVTAREALKLHRQDKRDSIRLREILTEKGPELSQLMRLMHNDEKLVIAVFVQREKIHAAIVGHKDIEEHKRLIHKGVIVTIEAVTRHAALGVVKFFSV